MTSAEAELAQLRKDFEVLERIHDATAEELTALRGQMARLRTWMAEYPNDKYTGAWWLAEFDRINGEVVS